MRIREGTTRRIWSSTVSPNANQPPTKLSPTPVVGEKSPELVLKTDCERRHPAFHPRAVGARRRTRVGLCALPGQRGLLAGIWTAAAVVLLERLLPRAAHVRPTQPAPFIPFALCSLTAGEALSQRQVLQVRGVVDRPAFRQPHRDDRVAPAVPRHQDGTARHLAHGAAGHNGVRPRLGR